ncbi:MAG: TlpA family protein disulfide reductase, partial [Gammaproteobacteria bacterium]
MNLKKISLYIFIFLLMGCSDPDLVTNKNKKIFLDDLKGQWIVINYWADWCPPCIKEIPELNALNEKHKDNLKVFLYNFDRLEGKELEEQL